MKIFTKQPGDLLDYDIDLSQWLPERDELVDVEISHDPGVELQSYRVDPASVKLWIGGGVDGETYRFRVLAKTGAGRAKEVDFMIAVADR